MDLKPGYKQSDLGPIPVLWQERRLVDIAAIGSGGTPSREIPHYWNGTIPWITTSQIDFNEIAEADQYITEAGLRNSAAKVLPPGTLLMALYGQGKTRGKVGVITMSAATNQACASISLVAGVSRDFVRYFLASRYEAIRSASNGGSQDNLSGHIVKGLPIALPPIGEQRAIAGALSDVDALLGALDRLIVKKRDLKQAVVQQLLTGQTRLPGFTGKWETKCLGEEAAFHKGKGLPKSALNPFGAEPCIHYGELFTSYPETVGPIISRTDTPRSCFRSLGNDVLMPTSDVTPTGLAKASCVGIGGVILGGDILVIRAARDRVSGSFLSYVIRHEKVQVLQLVSGTTVFHLYASDMKRFTFSLPPLREQQAIADVLSDMDAEIAALAERRDKTRLLKQGMMQELLTGRMRLV